jgi:hypothetical protein
MLFIPNRMSRMNEFGIIKHGLVMTYLFAKIFVYTVPEFEIYHHYCTIYLSRKESISGIEMIEGPLKFLFYGILVSSLILVIEFIHFKIRDLLTFVLIK